jgi:exodeoxyribonuclease VII large subunit
MENTGVPGSVLTVSEITRKIKGLLENSFPDVWVRGEISNFRTAHSGHCYFTLKDEAAVIKAVLFKGHQRSVPFEPGDGMNVIVHGNVDLFEKRGEYQIIVDLMEMEGKGVLQLAFEQLKAKLLKEGLFDVSRKKSIPPFPDSIGIVTSPTGAALRDILHVVGRRYRGMRIVIYPVLVQGEGAAADIAGAIAKANARNEVDVLIVGRGGGSIEDLWPFNEEIVARAIYDSRIPVVSAVGHEIDFTISDFVADLRAPTPSAAAELVVKNKAELLRSGRELVSRLFVSFARTLSDKREKAAQYSEELLSRRMTQLLQRKSQILDDTERVLTERLESCLSTIRGRFEKAVGQLNVLSPLNTLARGFAVVSRLPEDRPVFSISELSPGDDIKSRLRDGLLFSRISDIQKLPP